MGIIPLLAFACSLPSAFEAEGPPTVEPRVVQVLVTHAAPSKRDQDLLALTSFEKANEFARTNGYRVVDLGEERVGAYHESLFSIDSFAQQLQALKVLLSKPKFWNGLSSRELTTSQRQDVLELFASSSYEYGRLGPMLQEEHVDLRFRSVTHVVLRGSDGRTVQATLRNFSHRPMDAPASAPLEPSAKAVQAFLEDRGRMQKEALPPRDMVFTFVPELPAASRAELAAELSRELQNILQDQVAKQTVLRRSLSEAMSAPGRPIEPGTPVKSLPSEDLDRIRQSLSVIGSTIGLNDQNAIDNFLDSATIDSVSNLNFIGFGMTRTDGRRMAYYVELRGDRR